MGKNSESVTGDAKSHLLDLLTRSGESVVAEFSQIKFNIDFLDKQNNRFAPSAIALLEAGDSEERETALDVLRTWVTDDYYVPVARTSASAENDRFGTKHNESSYILEQVIREKSHERILSRVPDELMTLNMSKHYFGDQLILKHRASMRPDLFTASNEEIDRYYHPLIIVTSLFDPRNDEERFFREAPEFIEWAAASEDMHSALSSALHIQSINPATIQAIMGMRAETSVPLYDGLL